MLLLLRHPRTWLVLGWTLVALVVLASLLPGQSLPSTGANDKFEHTTAYALLTLWFAGIYPRSRYAAIAIGLFALGILIEIGQGMMQVGRQADWRDVFANALGILIGLTISWFWLGGWAQRVEARVESWTQRTESRKRS